MDTQNELDIITRIRGEVTARKELTGENLFLAWGYPTAIVMFMEFVALMVWKWPGLPSAIVSWQGMGWSVVSKMKKHE